MYLAIGIVSFFCGVAGIGIIYMLCKRNGLKKDGEIISGRKLSCEEIVGRPNRYVVKAEYRINGEIRSKNLVTTDKRVKECADNGEIQLLYVDKLDKIFWAQERSYEMIFHIAWLGVFSAFMFLLSLICCIKG